MAAYAPRQALSQPRASHPHLDVPPGHHPPHTGPSGTLQPGTKVQVGKYVVRVEKFLSEGGFAHVYVASLISPSYIEGFSTTQDKFVLKRMAVPDKAGLAEVRKEVDVMKQLRPHKHVVYFIEASASSIPGTSGYEIFILMEYCPGGGIIDLLNSRLQNRLTESEILKIFSDTCEAVAHMHSQQPLLMHRDLKVENILVAAPNLYKLCDFGSTATPLPRPQSTQEIQALEADLNKHTTLQYRAPEMVDVWSRKGVDEKADIWALGVFLYKLCYYTTPFEDQGPLAIVNVQYKFPQYPAYSDRIRALIGTMLQESAGARPDIWKVHELTCQLRGLTSRLARPSGSLKSVAAPQPPSVPSSAPPHHANGLDSIISAPSPIKNPLPPLENVAPMRRGRPAKAHEGSDVEKSGGMARTGGATVHGPVKKEDPSVALGARDKGKASWVIPGTATGEETPDELDLFAREAAAGFGDAFVSPRPTGTAGNGKSAALTSFGDSFAPSISVPAEHAEAKASSVAPAVSTKSGGILGTTHGLRPTPGVSRAPSRGTTSAFDDLVPPSRKTEAAPTLNQLRRSPSNMQSSPIGSLGGTFTQDGRNKVVTPAAATAKATDAQSPDLLNDVKGGAESTVTSKIATGGNWRMPKEKPDLVSRSSQTSPDLLLPLMPPQIATAGSVPQPLDLLGDDDVGPAALPSSGAVTSSNSNYVARSASKRLSMPIASFDFSAQAATRERFKPRPQASMVKEAAEPALPPRPQAGATNVKPPDGDSRPRPSGPRRGTLESLSSDSSDEEPESADTKFSPRFGGLGATQFPTTSWTGPKRANPSSDNVVVLKPPSWTGGASRPVSKASVPTKRLSPPTISTVAAAVTNSEAARPARTEIQDPISASSTSEMSEEDPEITERRRAAIAKFAPAADAQPPPAVSPALSDDGRDPFASRTGNRSKSPEAVRAGGRAFSTGGGPPIRAPKPQSYRHNAAISNLVLRYESASSPSPAPTPASPTAAPVMAGQTTGILQTKAKPVVPAKNLTGASTAGKQTNGDNFQTRFPVIAENLNGSGSDRPRFRPTTRATSPPKPSTDVGTVPVRRAHIPRASLGPAQLLPPLSKQHDRPPVEADGKGDGDEEETFTGVGSMKSRWEAGNVKRAEAKIRAPRTDYGQTG